MSIQNPSNLYHGNAVILDSRPSINLAVQLMAKRQAKKDALDQYYSKLQDQTLGQEDKMRPKDIEKGWGKKLNDWQMFYMNPENKKNILNPNRDGYKTINQFNAMHQDLIADARKSKDRLSQEMKIAALNNSGHWNPTDSDKEEAHQISKDIYDNTSLITENDEVSGLPITREPSINYLSTNYPAFDANKQSQFSKNVIGDIKPKYDESKARFDNKTGEIFLPKNYSTEDVKTIADNAGKINTRSSAGIFYEEQLHELAKNPAALDQATKVYQSVYGKVDKDGNPNLVDTPQKVAQADYIIKAMQAGGEEKITDGLLKQRLSQKFAKEQQARGIAAANTRQQRGFYHTDNKDSKQQEETNQWIDGFIDNGVEASKKYPLINGKRTVPLDPVTAKALTKSGIEPTGMQISEDGKVFTPIYPTYSNGAVTGEANTTLSQPLDRESLKLNLGYKTLTKKELGNTMKGKSAPTSSLNASERRKK